jgi:hypothetical protein
MRRMYNMTVKDIVIDLSKYSDEGYSLENLENYVEDNSIPIIESLIPCGSVDVQAAYGAPEAPLEACPTKYSGDTVNLQSTPNSGIGPYTVRFWKKAGGTGGTYSLVGTEHYPITEGSPITESFIISDFDVSSATGDLTAGAPTSDDVGIIIEPFGGLTPLASGKIRVATTVADSCPTGPKICISYCDITLGCVAPTCNFSVL